MQEPTAEHIIKIPPPPKNSAQEDESEKSMSVEKIKGAGALGQMSRSQ